MAESDSVELGDGQGPLAFALSHHASFITVVGATSMPLPEKCFGMAVTVKEI